MKPVAATVPPVPVRVAPLFRKFDWLALLITFVVLWGIYLFTLAPELTLEDSGELCTGSFYAGIPHPPGYPFWAIYSWLWTALLPIGNVAWRVEVGESFAAAMGCGCPSGTDSTPSRRSVSTCWRRMRLAWLGSIMP